MKRYITDINNNIYLKEDEINIKKKTKKLENVIEIFETSSVSSFLGFGSAITESASVNFSLLSKENQKKFLDDYFSLNGLNLNFIRVSIGSNDFSLKSFQYAKKKDLSDFSIDHDKKYVIPFIQKILDMKKVSLIASPWSPPRMYKRLPILSWGIKLKKKYYESYSNYLIKYLEEYRKLGININYITMQNEPIARQKWESCTFNLDEQKEFIYENLLPKLQNTKLLLWDHNKENLFNIVNYLYLNNKKIAGTCFHYYTGHCFDEIKNIHNKYPNMLLINSEMCTGYAPYNEKNWIRDAEYYLKDIIGDMNSGINAYLDWNVLLDEEGGPTYKKNPVKSPSIRVSDKYVKSSIYYYLYHISHFVSNSMIVKNKNNTNLKVVSCRNNNKLVVVIMNDSSEKVEYNVVNSRECFSDCLSAHSIVTYVITP